jgi:hypothetical protein
MVFTDLGTVRVRRRSALWRRDMFSFVCHFRQFCTFRSQFGNISLHVVPENRHHDVLDHVTKIFLRDEPLAQCFPPCTTGQREREFREYATMQLRSGCCVMALDGSTVIGACLNRPLTRDEVMLNSVPTSVGPGMNWHFICFEYQHVFKHILLGVSNTELGEQNFVATRDTKLLFPSQENDFNLDSDIRVGSQKVICFWAVTDVVYPN